MIIYSSVPEPEGRGDWYRKLPFAKRYCPGGARILAERGGERAWEGAQGGKVGGRAGQGIRRAVVCLSVCLLRVELVRAALANRHEIFGGGQGHGQERLSPEPAQSVKIRARKGRKI